jgi:hypothetical protein
MRKIIGFFHIAQIGGSWEWVHKELWNKLHTSGLYTATERIYVNIVGTNGEPPKVISEILLDPKVIVTTMPDAGVFEYPTLAKLQHVALDMREPFYVYYIHTKGATTASHPHEENKNGAYWWNQYIAHYTIIRWRDNVEKLDEGYEATGVEWRVAPLIHFSGNFWWASSDYILRLPPGEVWQSQRPGDRIMAEMYIGAANPKYYCFKNTWQNLYLYNCTPDQWT